MSPGVVKTTDFKNGRITLRSTTRADTREGIGTNDWLSLAEHIEKGSKTTYFTALVDGKRTSTLFGDPISAILHGIGYKYDGINTRYHQFAVAMLPGLLKEIESNDNQ